MNKILEIKNLYINIGENPILKGINLSIKRGEIHVIMGPNGSGKSTLSKVLAGHPAYKVIKGEILFNKENIIDLDPAIRSHKGLFLAFQYPIEVPGVTNEDFLRLIYNSSRKASNLPELNPIEFLEFVIKKLELVNMNLDFLYRNVNEGFSGGEKKRNEILQFAILNSTLGILDEIDSGLDIDALKSIASSINKLKEENKNKSLIIITHYNRLLNYIKPDFIHVIVKGKIIKSGDYTLAQKLEKKGYKWLS